MVIAKWADYSGGYPGGAALKAAGFTGVIRYVGIGGSTKRITAAEYRDLVTNGLQVLLVCELNTQDSQGGYNTGVSYARSALADARALGIPDSVGIAATADEHLTAAQVAVGLDFVRGFRDVLGLARTGAYGFAEFIDAVHAAGLAGWWVKCGVAPTAAEAPWITFWQRNAGQTTQTVNRIIVDIDDQDNPLGTDVNLTDSVTNPSTGKSIDNVNDFLYWTNLYAGQSATGATAILNALTALTAAINKTDADVLATDGDVKGIPALLTAEEATFLAAVQATLATSVQVSPEALQTALAALNIPTALAQALVALLAKAATPTPAA